VTAINESNTSDQEGKTIFLNVLVNGRILDQLQPGTVFEVLDVVKGSQVSARLKLKKVDELEPKPAAVLWACDEVDLT
jgi:hypothetical protein